MTDCGRSVFGRFQWAASIAAAGLLAMLPAPADADPTWWANVLDGSETNDFAAINMGQLKWMATNAADHLNIYLRPDGVGPPLQQLLDTWLDDGTNYIPVTVGQLKHLGSNFYERLLAVGYTNAYPWTDDPQESDYAAANVGQVKTLFAFDLKPDADADGISDWWEHHHFGALTSATFESDFDLDGFTDREEWSAGTEPGSAFSLPGPALYVDPLLGDDVNAGTWAAPLRSIVAGVAAAANGTRVVLLPGTYAGASNRNVSLGGKAIGVAGIKQDGFASIIDCDDAGRAFVFTNGETRATFLRHVLLRNAHAVSGSGGALYLDSASPTIERCAFLTCRADVDGGVAFIRDGAPLLCGNILRGNSALEGTALYVVGAAAPEIRDCLLDANAGESGNEGVVYCGDHSAPFLVNNTIANNFGAGLVAAGASTPTNVNGLMAFNDIGVRQLDDGSVIQHHTCAFGNREGDYDGFLVEPTGLDGNISADPAFAALEGGDLAIQTNSPCANAGDESIVESGDFDLRGNQRRTGLAPAMGSLEPRPPIQVGGGDIFVWRDAQGAHDGSSWADAFQTISAALIAAAHAAVEPQNVRIWVAMGDERYAESLVIKEPYMNLYGGFDATEDAFEQRDATRNRTILTEGGPAGAGAAVTVVGLRGGLGSILDGFTIEESHGTPLTFGGGGGIAIHESMITIRNCVIHSCSRVGGGGAIGGGWWSSVTLENVIMTNNTTTGYDAGARFVLGGRQRLVNCVIADNHAGIGGAVGFWDGSIINCTIVGNEGLQAPAVRPLFSGTILNSIVWGNTPDTDDDSQITNKTGITVSYSDVQGGWTGTGEGNMDGNEGDAPKFYPGTYYLTQDSPCLGLGTMIGAPAADIDGEPRPWPEETAPDIGADEFCDADGDEMPDWWEQYYFSGTGSQDGGNDYDGDGLYNLAEYQHETSPDNSDTDGDGLPDGWEVQHGLDPLDAAGENGSGGDPDGDGFSNAEEYSMGGAPLDPASNATQLIHRLMNCRNSSLRVDVDDSSNCGGGNSGAQAPHDDFDIGPLVECGYLLAVTVEGSVEDQASGYDKVSIDAAVPGESAMTVDFFEGNANGSGCNMAAKTETKNVWFWSDGSISLIYRTVDEQFHVGGYAEIIGATYVDVIKVVIEEPDGLPIQALQTGDSYFRTAAPWCFEWQFVHADYEIVSYHESQTIDGLVSPIAPAGYNWFVSAGTLDNADTETPTYVPDSMTVPSTVTTVDLDLRPINGSDVCMQSRSLEVYRDHLERDFENFGSGISCFNSWPFSRFSTTVTMGNSWNCHGGTRHAYDGTGNGLDLGVTHFFESWTTAQYAYPFSSAALTAISAMSRGDVVSYHCTSKDAAAGPGHAATSMGGDVTWGANNASMVFNSGSGEWDEAWLWGQSTVNSTASDLAAHWPSAFPGWTLDYISIHERP